jgi:hypothetical protein
VRHEPIEATVTFIRGLLIGLTIVLLVVVFGYAIYWWVCWD